MLASLSGTMCIAKYISHLLESELWQQTSPKMPWLYWGTLLGSLRRVLASFLKVLSNQRSEELCFNPQIDLCQFFLLILVGRENVRDARLDQCTDHPAYAPSPSNSQK